MTLQDSIDEHQSTLELAKAQNQNSEAKEFDPRNVEEQRQQTARLLTELDS